MSTTATYRDFKFGVTRGVLTPGKGCQYLRSETALDAYPERITDSFLHWVKGTPTRTWMARRGASGDWLRLSYAEAWARAARIGQALLDMRLDEDRPVAILSENSIEHALLALACMRVGVPHCPVSPAYSLMSQDFSKLKHVLQTLTPGLVWAGDARYEKALGVAQTTGAATMSVDLPDAVPTPAVDAAFNATGPDSIVKFLFTSGSTKLPKAVINTHRMWCANQRQMKHSMPVLAEVPPVLVDWLPWNHTFGGNHNFGLVMTHGGTLYINDGKPTPAHIDKTLQNLREVSPTCYFDVPVGFELIANAMQSDAVLRKSLLKDCRMFFYAGAALAQPVWDSLFESQERELGQRIVMGTGLGMTESSPFGVFVTNANVRAGDLGLPTPGLELKLVPTGDKTEIRYKGPNITLGYWRNPDATREAFDDEGFFCTGDAVKWIDDNDIHQGLKFDGRVAEDFKLATGTFVSVGPLRAKIIAACAPYVQDAVITGINRKEVGALLIATPKLASLGALESPAVAAHFQNTLNALAATATGSATKVVRMHILAEPPSIDKGEITDKGSINQRAVLQHRDALVEALYAGTLERLLMAQT